MKTLHYFIPLLPALVAPLVLFGGRWIGMKGAWLSIAAVATSFLLSVDLFWKFLDGSLSVPLEKSFTWFEVGIYRFEWGMLLDGPALTMCVMVSAVSLLVQVYSVGYMHDALRVERFFSYVSFFTAAMLALVVSNNFLQFFIGWELMGACSYLLISFDFERDAAGAAGQKAFLMTRLGDLGFYAGLLVLFLTLGTFNFSQIYNHVSENHISTQVASAIALLLLCGTIGKSAQVPLHTWLPDAMEGPTPVSALIHAATMVAGGIYLIVRAYPIFQIAPDVLHAVSWVGATTLFLAATMALCASDMKKVLAFSTISQLGYMVLGLGVLGYSESLFHLTTHAAFKALLFLGAGSIIHAVHTNDMWKLGSLSKQMPITTVTFAAGTLALMGFMGTSGFFSKEGILSTVFAAHEYALFSVGCLGGGLTSFYAMRAFCLIFLGEPRERDRFAHAQESPWSMVIPLLCLALPSLFLGFLMKDHLSKFFPFLADATHGPSFMAEAIVMGSGLLGMAGGWMVYGKRTESSVALAKFFKPIHRLLLNHYYVDRVYRVLFVQPTWGVARGLDWFDLHLIDRIVYLGGFSWVPSLYRLIFRGFAQISTQTLLLLMTFAVLVMALLWSR